MIRIRLKQTNKALKCPTCNKYGLRQVPNDMGAPYDTSGMFAIGTPFFNKDKAKRFECKNCYARFEEVKKKK